MGETKFKVGDRVALPNMRRGDTVLEGRRGVVKDVSQIADGYRYSVEWDDGGCADSVLSNQIEHADSLPEQPKPKFEVGQVVDTAISGATVTDVIRCNHGGCFDHARYLVRFDDESIGILPEASLQPIEPEAEGPKPKFKAGDKVKNGMYDVAIVLGPFWPGVNLVGQPVSNGPAGGTYSYVIEYAAGQEMQGLKHKSESALQPVERWERVEGQYRYVETKQEIDCPLERKAEG